MAQSVSLLSMVQGGDMVKGGKRGMAADAATDLRLAVQIEQLLFPKTPPACDWCCIGMKNRMASGLGGDYFDFITMSDGCQAVYIGDVTGHGVHASVVMALIYGYMHRAARETCNPLTLVTEVNNFLCYFAERSQLLDYFFSSTIFFGVIDPQSLQMNYVNAGHGAPMVVRGDTVTRLLTTGQPIGFFNNPEMEQRMFQFVRGDRFLLYTDGITESANSEHELFGSERVEQMLLSKKNGHQEFLDHLFAALRDFGADDTPADDCTAILMDFHG